jgi:heptosyltransferase-1
MRVLIVKVSALGDVVHALPVLAWLKSADPGMEIDWLVEEAFAPLLEGHPLIHRVHRLATKAWRRQGIGKACGGRGSFRRFARNDTTSPRLAETAERPLHPALRAPLRYGFGRDGAREWPNLLATNRRVPLSEADFHVSERSLAVARAAFPGGSERPLAGPLPVVPSADAAVAQRLRETGMTGAPLVVLHYGTTWTTKLWPLDRWCDWRCLRRRGVRPVLTQGNDTELAAVEQILEAATGRPSSGRAAPCRNWLACWRGPASWSRRHRSGAHRRRRRHANRFLYRVTDARRNGPRGPAHPPAGTSRMLAMSAQGLRPRHRVRRSIAVAEVLRAVERLLPPTRRDLRWRCHDRRAADHSQVPGTRAAQPAGQPRIDPFRTVVCF